MLDTALRRTRNLARLSPTGAAGFVIVVFFALMAVLAPVLLAESAGRVAVTARGWQP